MTEHQHAAENRDVGIRWWGAMPYEILRGAACSGMDLEAFYAESAKATLSTRQVCFSCPVQAECLQWALHREEYGFFGGTTYRERLGMRRRAGITLYGTLAPPIPTLETRRRSWQTALEAVRHIRSRFAGLDQDTRPARAAL